MEQAGRDTPGRLVVDKQNYLAGVAGVAGFVGAALLPPQPTATTENARTAARTSNFFI